MAGYQVRFGMSAAPPDFYPDVARLEVEESADQPGALSLELPTVARDGELTWVGDARVGPYANIAVVVTPDRGDPQCLFDGYVLGHNVRVPAGPTGATVEIYGQDAGVLMGLTETVKEWSGRTDSQVAADIFAKYHITPAAANSRDTAPAHTPDGHTLMQRGTDLHFLRSLARRTGRWFRVYSGTAAGQRNGWFAPPDLSGSPVATIVVNDDATRTTQVLDFAWNVTHPTAVRARQASLTDADQNGISADTSDSGLRALADRGLAAFAGQDRTLLLTAAADADELPYRAGGVLREAAWFTHCTGTADAGVLGTVLRVGDLVTVAGCGALLSGRYLVRRVRHQLTAQAHVMSFELVRNAVGPGVGPAAGLTGALSGALGGLL